MNFIKNLNIVKKKEADNFFSRNYNYYNAPIAHKNIFNLIKNNNLSSKSILEIGCANGKYLHEYYELLKPSYCYGVDLSKKAIKDGKKKFKKIKFLNISSLEIDKINKNFDLVICGFFLYLLDRNQIFKQFDLIYNILNENGHLIIVDFDPLFKHTNKNLHNNNLKSFKMNYDNFLIETGLFEMYYKFKYKIHAESKKKFKSENVSMTLFKKINFQYSYPENF